MTPILPFKQALLIFLLGAGCALAALLLHGCGSAQANDISIQIVYAPDATPCYVIEQNGAAVGGNCK